jgi:hypothetical protein
METDTVTETTSLFGAVSDISGTTVGTFNLDTEWDAPFEISTKFESQKYLYLEAETKPWQRHWICQ